MRYFFCFTCFLFTMNKICQIICKCFFLFISSAIIPFFHFIQFFYRNKCKHTKALHNICIINIAPILVKLIWCCFSRIKPDCTFRSFPHLLTFTVHQQRNRHCIRIFSRFSTNQICTCKHITPLIISTKLHITAIMLIQV